MRTIKLMLLALITASLLAGNVASAAMTCCAENGAQVKQDMTTPCHKSSDKDSGHQDNSCKLCKSCVNVSVLPVIKAIKTVALSDVIYDMPVTHFVSFKPVGIDSPPKTFS